MINIEQGGITNLQRLREFVDSLPTKELKDEFKEYIIEEKDCDIFTQEDMELIFISDNYDELEKLGWLTEC